MENSTQEKYTFYMALRNTGRNPKSVKEWEYYFVNAHWKMHLYAAIIGGSSYLLAVGLPKGLSNVMA